MYSKDFWRWFFIALIIICSLAVLVDVADAQDTRHVAFSESIDNAA